MAQLKLAVGGGEQHPQSAHAEQCINLQDQIVATPCLRRRSVELPRCALQ